MGGKFLFLSLQVDRMAERLFIFSDCRPIVDADGLIIGVLGAIPKDEDWGEVCRKAEAALEDACGKLLIQETDKFHHRGAYSAFRAGISHGGGQKVRFLCHLLLYFANLLLVTQEAWPFNMQHIQLFGSSGSGSPSLDPANCWPFKL